MGSGNAQNMAWGDLSRIFDTSMGTANKLGPAGFADQDAVSKFYMPLLSGDRTAMEQAVAPETNAITARSDAARNERARTGTSRTGGDVAANLSAGDDVRAQIDTLLGSLRPHAADATAELGHQRISQMMQSLGLGVQAASSFGQQATQQRGADQQNRAATATNVIKLIGLLATL